MIVNGAVVLDDTDGLAEGTRFMVLIDEPDDTPVTVDEEELAAIDRGLRDVAARDVLDARAFVAELRRQS